MLIGKEEHNHHHHHHHHHHRSFIRGISHAITVVQVVRRRTTQFVSFVRRVFNFLVCVYPRKASAALP